MSPDTDLEAEYSPSSVSKHPAPWYIEEYARRSAVALRALGDRVTRERYGPADDEYVVLARCEPTSPLLVFIHGGYWRALSADECAMWAGEALDAGFSFASINYTLAPTATLERIVTQCRTALDWLLESAGLEPARVVVAGSSAGGHLAAMVTTANPQPVRCDGAVLLSGVFDLRPLVATTVNEPLGLTVPDAVRLSPAHLRITTGPRVRAFVGKEETDAFKAQSNAYVDKLRAAGVDATSHVVDGCDHFDLIYDLITPGTELGDTTIGLLRA
jgi:arylformamidase